MRRSTSAIVIGLVALVMGDTSAAADDKPPGCFKRDELEASIQRERKIPYDEQAPRLKSCNITQPLVNKELWEAAWTRVAIIVFDVTGSGRVVEQQLIGQKSPWTEISQKEVDGWLFEPLVENGIGITRVGVTVALIAEFQNRGRSCGPPQGPPVISGIDFEIRICARRG